MQKKLDSVNDEKIALESKVKELSQKLDSIEQKEEALISKEKEKGIKLDEALKGYKSRFNFNERTSFEINQCNREQICKHRFFFR